jgi:hypothetical protein
LAVFLTVHFMAGSSVGESTVSRIAARTVLFYPQASENMVEIRDYAPHFGFTVLSSATGGCRRGPEAGIGRRQV